MKLPERFSFTQQNLQDYSDCPRRFYLRHILKQEWPSIETEPVREQERAIELGQNFHRLVQQYFAGIPANLLESTITDPDLQNWWQQFLALKVNSLPGEKICENTYSIQFEAYRLLAKFDLIIYQAKQSITIYDWKTSRHSPSRNWLKQRAQTKVYPYVIAELTKTQPSTFAASPDQIEMVYWYPASPQTPVRFQYSEGQLAEDAQLLQSMIAEILQKAENDFQKTENEKLCAFCRYRSLCNRGITAGNLNDIPANQSASDSVFEIDFSEILPIDL